MEALLSSVAQEEGSAGKLSKSQKKRMKRKDSKARKAQQQEKHEGLASPALNPHEKLRQQAMAEGYTPEQVDVALEEMWNLKLQYDELEAVLAFLRSNEHRSEAETEETTVMSTTSTDALDVAPAGHPYGEKEDFMAPPKEEAVEESKESEEAEEAPQTPPQEPQQSAPKKGNDLLANLEVVAGADDVYDAAYALASWAAGAAKTQDVLMLCSPQKTQAFPIIIRRTILERQDDSKFESAVLSAVLDLVAAILQKGGVGEDAEASTRTSLASVLRHSREVRVSEDMADVVADYVISTVAQAVDKAKYSVSDGAEAVRQIEEEIDALASSLVANGGGPGGVVELMSKRDTQKSAAEKSSNVVGITLMATSPGGATNGQHAVSGKLSTEEGQTVMLASLMGEEMFASAIHNRREHDALRSQLERNQSTVFAESQQLTHDMQACQSRREEIAARKEILRRELEELEAEDSALDQKIVAAEDRLHALDESCSEEVRQLKSELAERAERMEVENAMRQLVHEMITYEQSLLKAVTDSASSRVKLNGGDENLSDKVSNKMGIYLVRMRNYFRAEADCVEFMLGRAKTLERGIKDLEMEIQECAALGMTTNVAQMTENLSKTRGNIGDDLGVVDALRAEAGSMKKDLFNRLEEYHNISSIAAAHGNTALTSLHASVLNGIAEALSRIGLPDDGTLGAYVAVLDVAKPISDNGPILQPVDHGLGSELVNGHHDESNYGEPESQDAVHVNGNGHPDVSVGHDDESKTNDTDDEPVNGAPVTEVAPAMPKLSWASAAAGESKTEVKSLLDIQKEEELSAKTT